MISLSSRNLLGVMAAVLSFLTVHTKHFITTAVPTSTAAAITDELNPLYCRSLELAKAQIDDRTTSRIVAIPVQTGGSIRRAASNGAAIVEALGLEKDG